MRAIRIFNEAFSTYCLCRLMRALMLVMAILANSLVLSQASAQTNEPSPDELIAQIAQGFRITTTNAMIIYNLMQTSNHLRSSGDTLLATEMDKMAVAIGILGRFELEALSILPRLEAGVRGSPIAEPLASEVKAAARLYMGGMSMAASVATTINEIVIERALRPCREMNPGCLSGLNRALDVAKTTSALLNSIVATVPSWAIADDRMRLIH